MQTDFQVAGQGSQKLALQQNRVLRNTYMLLGLTMVPTVIGALLGIQMQFSFLAGSPFIAFMLFLGVAWGFMWGIEKNKNSGLGVALLLGFTFFMGLMLSRILQVALGFSNGGKLVATAFAGTSAVFCAMAMLSSVVKRDLSQMGKFLFIGMVMLLVAMIANFFIQSSALMITLSVLAIGIFSLFILHDLKRVQDGLETNYISATLGVYLSLYNVFQSLLAMFGILGGED